MGERLKAAALQITSELRAVTSSSYSRLSSTRVRREEKKLDYQKIGMVMDVPFASFGLNAREQFLTDLAELTGLLKQDVKEASFWRGCVRFEAKIDAEAAQYLLDLYDKSKSIKDNEKPPESVLRLMEFIQKYHVSKINGTGISAKVLAVIDKGSEEDRDAVFFIHGWRGDAQSFGFLPEYISDESNLITKTYEYPTAATGRVPSIYFVAQNLDNWMRNNIKSDKRQVAIVAHSMGGLIARKTLASQYYRNNPLDSRVRQITFVASPHTGVWVAKLSKFLGGMQSFQTSELGPDSPVLAEIVQTWSAWLKKDGNMQIPVRSVFGTKDDVVDPAIAIGNDPEAVPILGAGHIDIIKPTKKSDEIVQTIARFMREAHLGNAA